MENMQTLTRVFQIIEAMSEKEFYGVRELKLKTNINTTTIHRILFTLVNLGYVWQNKETEKYALTYKFVSIGNLIARKNSIVSIVHPYLKKLSNDCNETINFVERNKNRIRYIDKVTPSKGIFETSSYIGLELPLTSTAVGKIILSNLTEKEIEEVWNSEEIIIFTENTIVKFEDLKKELDEAKKTGFAYDLEEREKGVTCIAVGLSNGRENCKYAISVSGPSANMSGKNLEKIKHKLLQAKKELLRIL